MHACRYHYDTVDKMLRDFPDLGQHGTSYRITCDNCRGAKNNADCAPIVKVQGGQAKAFESIVLSSVRSDMQHCTDAFRDLKGDYHCAGL